MGILSKKFHVKKNGTTYECNCYTSSKEATPVNIKGLGECLPILVDGDEAYLGLWPVSVSGGSYHTPLIVRKNGIRYYVETQVESLCTVTITQSANQTITVYESDDEGVETAHTTTFNTIGGTALRVEVETSSEQYSPGTLNVPEEFQVFGDVNITVSSVTTKQCIVSVTQIDGYTLTVRCNNVNHTTDFLVPYGTTYTASVSIDPEYPSKPIFPGTSGTITDDVEFFVNTDGTIPNYTLTIGATSHQTITLIYTPPNGSSVTVTSGSSNKTYTVPYNTLIDSVSIAAATGYAAGKISGATNGKRITSNTSVTAAAATLKNFVLTLAATSNQTISLQYRKYTTSGTYGNWSSVQKSSTSAKTFTLPYNSQYKATIAANTGYNAGSLTRGGNSMTAGTAYSLTAAITVSASAAALKTFTLTLAATTHQTIKICYKNRAANGTLPSSWSSEISSGSSAKTYTLRYNSQVKVTAFTASAGYTKGTLKVGGNAASLNTAYAVKANTTITATAATAIKPTVTIQRKSNSSSNTIEYLATYTKPDGTSGSTGEKHVASTITIKYNTRVTIRNKKLSYYAYYYIGSTQYGPFDYNEDWVSPYLKSNTTININPVYDSSGSSSGEGSDGEGNE